jgi:lipopolysaccharide transport system permease protein
MKARRITIIGARRGWFDLGMTRLWDYRDLLLLFAARDIKVRYKQTLLGPAWLIVQPLALTAVFTTVFSGVVGVSTGNQPAPLFYLTGLISWSYFSQIVQSTSQVFLVNEHLFSKIYFPRIIVPASALLSNGLAIFIQFVVVLVFLVGYGVAGRVDGVSWRAVVFPLVTLQLAAVSLGVGLLFASSTAKYRDVANMTPFVLQLWMFVTPIIYPFSSIPEKYRTLLSFINPLAAVVEEGRWCFLGVSSIGVQQVMASIFSILVVLTAGAVIYQRVERNVMDTI